MRQQPGPVLGERRLVEGTAPDVQVEEPAEEHVVAQPFAELALRAHGVERDQQTRLQQVFGRHGGPASLGVHAAEGGRQLLKHAVCQRLDPPDRVFLWDQVLGGERHQALDLLVGCAAHGRLPFVLRQA